MNIMENLLKIIELLFIKIQKLCKGITDGHFPLDLSKDEKILIVENFSALHILKKAYKLLWRRKNVK